jgi:hypothetical protein
MQYTCIIGTPKVKGSEDGVVLETAAKKGNRPIKKRGSTGYLFLG